MIDDLIRYASPVCMFVLALIELFRNEDNSRTHKMIVTMILVIASYSTIQLAYNDFQDGDKLLQDRKNLQDKLDKTMASVQSLESAMQIYNASRGDESSLNALQMTQAALNNLLAQQPVDSFKALIPTILPSLKEQKAVEEKNSQKLAMSYETRYSQTIDYIEKIFMKLMDTTEEYCSIKERTIQELPNTTLGPPMSNDHLALYKYSNGVYVLMTKSPAQFDYGEQVTICRHRIVFKRPKSSLISLMTILFREKDALILFDGVKFKGIDTYSTRSNPMEDEGFKETIENGMSQIVQLVLRECSESKKQRQ